MPCALTIGGSDSGGGAGVQADLKTFAACDVHGASVLTCITAQNPRQVRGVEAVSADMVRRQLEAVFGALKPAAVKTGMLYNSAVIGAVADWWQVRGRPPLVVDPVMVATSGAPLLKPAALRLLRTHLLPRATLITPNLAEVETLLGWRPTDPEAMRTAARQCQEAFGCAVLVKGGHLPRCSEAIDLLYDGRQEWLFRARRLRSLRLHGTGCTYAAAITAGLARGLELPEAVAWAKIYVTGAIAHSRRVAGHTVLEHFWPGHRAPTRTRRRKRDPMSRAPD